MLKCVGGKLFLKYSKKWMDVYIFANENAPKKWFPMILAI